MICTKSLVGLALLCAVSARANPLEDPVVGPKIASALRWTKKVYLPPRADSNTTVYEDPRTGFRSLITIDPDTKEVIVAFRGTASPQSAASSLALNYPQFGSVEFLQTLRKVRQIVRAQGYHVDVIVTGHSSGGGLAEAFAYELMSATPELQRDNLRIDLVTWNGIGSNELFKERDPHFQPNPEVVKRINGVHLRGEHDVVSQFGRRFTGNEWTWSQQKTNFVGAHSINKVNMDDLKARKITPTHVAQRIGYLTNPAATRVVFLGVSAAMMGSMNACRILMEKVGRPTQTPTH